MIVRPAVCVGVCILIFALGPPLLAEENIFSISKSLDFRNENPSVAVNTNTGDVLVVWHQIDTNNNHSSNIYAALCKPKKNKFFKVGKARLISGKNDTCYYPRVAYSPETNSYLVTWQINSSTPPSIETQVLQINAGGKAVGKIITLFPEELTFDFNATLVAVPASVRDLVPGSVFLMSWYLSPRLPEENPNRSGLWTVMLDEKGNQVSAPAMVLKLDFKDDLYLTGEIIPQRIVTTENGLFYLAVTSTNISAAAHTEEAYIVKLEKHGHSAGKVLLHSGNNRIVIRVGALSNKRILASWYDYSEDIGSNQLLKPTLKKIKSPYTHFADADWSEPVGLSGGGAFQIISSSAGLYTARFNNKGKLIGDLTHHDSIPSLPENNIAVEITSMNKVLLVWHRAIDSQKTEIVGALIETN